jgi:hypothetical protein
MPTVAYCKDGPGCPEHTIRADYPITPTNVEVYEVLQTLGSDAAAIRGGQLERNRQRRQLHSDRKRFAAIALQKNLRLAADRLAEQKLAEKDVQEKLTAEPAAQARPDPSEMKKPPTSIDKGSLETAQQQKEAKSIA